MVIKTCTTLTQGWAWFQRIIAAWNKPKVHSKHPICNSLKHLVSFTIRKTSTCQDTAATLKWLSTDPNVLTKYWYSLNTNSQWAPLMISISHPRLIRRTTCKSPNTLTLGEQVEVHSLKATKEVKLPWKIKRPQAEFSLKWWDSIKDLMPAHNSKLMTEVYLLRCSS